MIINKFSDFKDSTGPLSGNKTKVDDIIGKEIIVHDFKIMKSKYIKNGNEECLTVQYKLVDSENFNIFFTGSLILKNQCLHHKEMLPFLTKIEKTNNALKFT